MRGLGFRGKPATPRPAAAPRWEPGGRGGPGAPGAMEQVQLINIQRLLEAAEYLERRERGNGREEPG